VADEARQAREAAAAQQKKEQEDRAAKVRRATVPARPYALAGEGTL
jgi:hypothetical protein